eukprot:6470663-Amphidinium_carterae.1
MTACCFAVEDDPMLENLTAVTSACHAQTSGASTNKGREQRHSFRFSRALVLCEGDQDPLMMIAAGSLEEPTGIRSKARQSCV